MLLVLYALGTKQLTNARKKEGKIKPVVRMVMKGSKSVILTNKSFKPAKNIRKIAIK